MVKVLKYFACYVAVHEVAQCDSLSACAGELSMDTPGRRALRLPSWSAFAFWDSQCPWAVGRH